MTMYSVLMMLYSLCFQAILGTIGGLGSSEILLILLVAIMGILRVAIPVVVIFFLYRWWKKKKNSSQ